MKKNDETEVLVKQYLDSGGKIQVLEPSKKRIKTWRGKSGAWSKGAKKINLQDKGFTS